MTLVELLVVLLVLALISTLVTPVISSAMPGYRLSRVANDIVSEIRTARAEAIGSNQPVDFNVDVDGKTYGVSHDAKKPIDPSIEVRLVAARELMPEDDVGQVRFFPDGTSSGGRLTLSEGKRGITIKVDWFDGSVERDV